MTTTPSGNKTLPTQFSLCHATPPATGVTRPRLAFVFDIDEVAGALARATESVVRPVFARACPAVGRTVNTLARRPLLSNQHVAQAARLGAIGSGQIVLLAGAWAAASAGLGARDNARAARVELAGWEAVQSGLRDDLSALLQAARDHRGPGSATLQIERCSQKLGLAKRYSSEAWWQMRAAGGAAGGAAAMAANLLLHPSLLGAVLPAAAMLSNVAMGAAIVLMGSYALAQVILAASNYRALGRLENNLACLQEGHAAKDNVGQLLQAMHTGRSWQLAMVVGGSLLGAGLVLQVWALWTGVATIFAGSLTLEIARQREGNLLPRPLPARWHDLAEPLLRTPNEVENEYQRELVQSASVQANDRLALAFFLDLRRQLEQAKPWLPFAGKWQLWPWRQRRVDPAEPAHAVNKLINAYEPTVWANQCHTFRWSHSGDATTAVRSSSTSCGNEETLKMRDDSPEDRATSAQAICKALQLIDLLDLQVPLIEALQRRHYPLSADATSDTKGAPRDHAGSQNVAFAWPTRPHQNDFYAAVLTVLSQDGSKRSDEKIGIHLRDVMLQPDLLPVFARSA